jgi:hypothetical protein
MRLLICLLILALPANAGEHIKRDPKAVRTFRAIVPCPATEKPERRCPGYVVDHIIPLCAGGADDAANMQWQSVEDAKIKDRAEREQCRKRSKSSRDISPDA